MGAGRNTPGSCHLVCPRGCLSRERLAGIVLGRDAGRDAGREAGFKIILWHPWPSVCQGLSHPREGGGDGGGPPSPQRGPRLLSCFCFWQGPLCGALCPWEPPLALDFPHHQRPLSPAPSAAASLTSSPPPCLHRGRRSGCFVCCFICGICHIVGAWYTSEE